MGEAGRHPLGLKVGFFFFVLVELNSQPTVPKSSFPPHLLPSKPLVLALALV